MDETCMNLETFTYESPPESVDDYILPSTPKKGTWDDEGDLLNEMLDNLQKGQGSSLDFGAILGIPDGQVDFTQLQVFAEEVNYDLTTIAPEAITPSNIIACPLIVDGAMPMATRRRKSLVIPRPSETPEYLLDIKPSIQKKAPTKKRAVKEPELYVRAKKPKKYELGDEEDPSVKNAKAAKANRERKKLELEALQKDHEERGILLEELKAQIEIEKRARVAAELRAENERMKRMATSGFQSMVAEVKEYLRLVVPPLNVGFGLKELVFKEPDDISYNNGVDIPGSTITTHFNFESKIMEVEYNPCPSSNSQFQSNYSLPGG